MGKVTRILLLLLVIFSPLIYVWVFVMPLVWQGDGALMKAYEEESLGNRYLEYNKAVEFYLKAEKRSPLLFRDWMLAERTGDALFALRDYPQASYYLWTAFLDHPTKETREKLIAVLQRLHSDETPVNPVQIAPSYVILFIGLCMMGLLLGLVYDRNRIAGILGVLCFAGFLYLAVLRFFSPVEGILMSDQSFKAAPGGETLIILPAGSKVSVIEVAGKDAKIRTANQSIGYVDDKSIRVLR